MNLHQAAPFGVAFQAEACLMPSPVPQGRHGMPATGVAASSRRIRSYLVRNTIAARLLDVK
eukprot:NODE_832_length_753_cov_719.353693_g637_i0.p2 GENE.NODE_832_length_753_cov_719.353693_g637_i0~~NODE_832_length_753_cov_719.353693_g637_i0.p2  ORF type:complete len:61 (+),score=6.36 NODE_832_length_753_cov_719.353693_g637_i0:89-271(+)